MPIFGMKFEQEKVPKDKKFMISTRDNSGYKWHAKQVVGALEVPSEPDLQLRLAYTQRTVDGKEELFQSYVKTWDRWGLREEFIQACENLPPETCCCGFVTDNDETIKRIAGSLNQGWIKSTNESLAKRGKKFRLDTFLWTWHNAVGKAETNILLIRFFENSIDESTS